MANRRLTRRLVDALKPDKSIHEIPDTELRGFGVRVLPSGRKRFFVHVQTNGRRTWKAIGDAGTMFLPEARVLARAHMAGIRVDEPYRPAGIATEMPFEDVAESEPVIG